MEGGGQLRGQERGYEALNYMDWIPRIPYEEVSWTQVSSKGHMCAATVNSVTDLHSPGFVLQPGVCGHNPFS